MTNSTRIPERQSRSPSPLKKLLEKALGELDCGDPQRAETFIELAIFEEGKSSRLIATLVKTLQLAQERLEINNCADEEDHVIAEVLEQATEGDI